MMETCATSAAQDASPCSLTTTGSPVRHSAPCARGTARVTAHDRAGRALPDVATLLDALDDEDYLADEALGTALFLAARMGQPILLEGEPGVGKTEAAKALAGALDTPLIRLQCYEGLTSAEALYEWNYPRQLLAIRLAEARGETPREADLFSAGLPAGAAAAGRARASRAAPGGAADRRGGPRRRRVRGVPVRAAGRVRGDDPRARHPAGGVPAGGGADLEPDPGPARRAQAALPVPLDRLPGHRPGRRDHPAPGAGRGGAAGRPGGARRRPGCAASTWPSRPAWPRRSAGPAALHVLGAGSWTRQSAEQTAGAVLKYAEDLGGRGPMAGFGTGG